MRDYSVVIIGGGPAGLAAAISCYDSGVKDILIIEREDNLGGILNQCIHNGFGLARFKESLTGPEYAERFINGVVERGIKYLTQTMVLSISKDKVVTAMNASDGVFEINAKAIILAMGCRERSKGALNIQGSRPSGIYSAGTAQKYVNILGYMPGKSVVILGSGDIGLIMARRMTLEGAKVHAVCEIMPHSSGLKRNIVQCLDDFNIPLYLSHTITNIEGDGRVTGCTISQVDENKNPIKGTEKHFECDTILFSVGLIPENELSKNLGVELSSKTKGAVVDENRETTIPGVFACGNVLQVHDLVDFVSEEAEIAGKSAANYLLYGETEKQKISVNASNNVSYVVPQIVDKNANENVKLFFRVNKVLKNAVITVKSSDRVIISKKKRIVVPGEMETALLMSDKIKALTGDIEVLVEGEMIKELTCIECPMGCKIFVDIKSGNISGNGCPRGKVYAENEVKSPKRVVTSTVKIVGGGLLPVKTDVPVNKADIFEVMKVINTIEVKAPINTGDIIMSGVCGANIVAAKTIK